MGFTCPKLLRELRGEARQHPRSVLEERVCDDARLGSFRPASPLGSAVGLVRAIA